MLPGSGFAVSGLPLLAEDARPVNARSGIEHHSDYHKGKRQNRIGADPSTPARWECGEREPAGAFLGPVKRFLHIGEEQCSACAGLA